MNFGQQKAALMRVRVKFTSGGPADLAMLKCRFEVPLAFCPAVTGGLAFTEYQTLLYIGGPHLVKKIMHKMSVIFSKKSKLFFWLSGVPSANAPVRGCSGEEKAQ